MRGLARQASALGGQLHLARGAFQQLDAEDRLQSLDAAGDRRLGDVQAFRGLAEAAGLGDGEEGFQFDQLDPHGRGGFGGAGARRGRHISTFIYLICK
ncbi:hypothetical protein D9M68_813500 [compost metagenome]